MNFAFKVTRNGKVIQRARTHSIKRFLKNLRMIKWKGGGIKVYVRVGYGKHIDVFGKRTHFYNDGWYERKEDLWSAFDVFGEGI